MTKSINFKTRKKDFLTVTFPDDTVIFIGTPTKAIFSALTTMQNELKDVNDTSDESLDSLYDACAVIMSRNKTGKKITREYLESVLDFEEIIALFNLYMEFIGDLSTSKNS